MKELIITKMLAVSGDTLTKCPLGDQGDESIYISWILRKLAVGK
jgi:hypothetical protein